MFSKKNFNVHFRIINIWFSFLLFLIIISNLPHQAAPIFTWLNCSIYFLIFLQAIYLTRREQRNKDIFGNIAIFALLHSISFIHLLIGKYELMGNDYLAWYFFAYLAMAQNFVFAFCILYIGVKYFIKNSSTLVRYIITFAAICPVFLWHYHPFIADKLFIIDHADAFDRGTLLFNFLPLFFIGLYAVLLYKHDRSLGEHINTIMVCFFIMLLMDITNQAGNMFHVTIFVLSQYVLTLTLSFFVTTLFRRLNFAYSEFGQFYDNLVVSGNKHGVPIKRKKGASSPLVALAKDYFHQRRNTIGFVGVLSIFCINYFDASPFIKLNVAAICLGILILFTYLTALYQKRLKNGNLVK